MAHLGLLQQKNLIKIQVYPCNGVVPTDKEILEELKKNSDIDIKKAMVVIRQVIKDYPTKGHDEVFSLKMSFDEKLFIEELIDYISASLQIFSIKVVTSTDTAIHATPGNPQITF